ncbi:MAG: glycine cleavage system protein GcvH [Pseudomonadota bacterium]
MMNFPADLKYSKDHEWLRIEGGIATVGVSDFAQDSLGDVVYVNLPEVGDEVTAGDSVAEIESVKAVSDVYSPVSGEIVAVNEELEGAEDTINRDPYGAGWLFKVLLAAPDELAALMDIEAYKVFVAEQAH